MKRCGYIAILGAPNAGKSTLMNQMIGGKVSIVSPKVQTTRVRVRGVCIEGESQLVFVDTPGIFDAKKVFEKTLVDEAWAGVGDADALLLIIDAKRGLDEQSQAIVERLAGFKGKKPLAVALNKVDTVDKPYLLKLATVLASHELFDAIFMISALSGSGVKDIRKALAKQMPEGPWLYPEDQLTDVPMRELAAEITREKLFLRLQQELPYSLTVETELWEQRNNGSARILQAIIVERESQKKIVIGEGGSTLKSVGIEARKELEKMLEAKVQLELFVKVESGWKAQMMRKKI